MTTPKDIINAINEGIRCPFCSDGFVFIDVDNSSLIPVPRVTCNKCFKRLQIDYRDNPFKILRIKEYKKL